MTCRICGELEAALAKAQKPDQPEMLVGLTEAGLRNRTHQRQERESKAELDLSKHRKACTKRMEEAAALEGSTEAV
jgi:hypothetical protein